LTLNEAAALLMMSGDLRRLLNLAAQIGAGSDPARLIDFCNENGIPIMVDEGYDPFHGRSDEEKREWMIFVLFLVRKHNYTPQGAFAHFEWVQQRPFQNVVEWLGSEGDKFREQWGRPISDNAKAAWREFLAERRTISAEEVDAELTEIHQQIERGEL